MSFTVAAMIDALSFEETGPDRYIGKNVDAHGGVVFGGQLMAQSIAAAMLGNEAKAVKTLHIVFARAGAPDLPLEIAVDRAHAGRAMATSGVTISQNGKVCTKAVVLMSADEPDLIRHADAAPSVGGPDDAPGTHSEDGWQIRTIGGVDISDPEAVGPPDLDVWTRFVGATADPVVNQALLSYATDGFLIGTAMRPHPGVGQALAHVTLSTGVLSHTITFHEPVNAADWHLITHHSPYAGRGRSYGRADIFATDGNLVASFVQDNMIRPMPQGSKL